MHYKTQFISSNGAAVKGKLGLVTYDGDMLAKQVEATLNEYHFLGYEYSNTIHLDLNPHAVAEGIILVFRKIDNTAE